MVDLPITCQLSMVNVIGNWKQLPSHEKIQQREGHLIITDQNKNVHVDFPPDIICLFVHSAIT